MKKMMFMAMMMVMTISANAMSYNAAKNEALFLSDKMAYELNLTAAQYEAVYEINLDYLMSLNGHADVFGIWWDRRNADLRFVLNTWQYEKYMSSAYFYRPVAWNSGGWSFGIYSHYDRGRFYNDRPSVFVTYKGGNNHKSDRFYADRHVTKPNVHHHTATTNHGTPTPRHDTPTPRNNDHTWHNTGSHNTHSPQATHNTGSHNTHNSHSGSGHFGRK